MAFFYDDKPLWDKAKELTDQCRGLQDAKADAKPIWDKAGEIERWIKHLQDDLVAKLRGDHDGLTQRFSQLTTQLEALDQHLKVGLPDELQKLCNGQIKAIGELCDRELTTMRGLSDNVSGHARATEQSMQACQSIQQSLGEMGRSLREYVQRSEEAVADQLAVAQKSAQQCDALRTELTRACGQAARELTELKVAAETAAQTAQAKASVAVKQQAEAEVHVQQVQADLALLRSEAAALKADIKEGRTMLEASQAAASQAKASQTAAEASARHATETMAACASFRGRLRWLFCGSAASSANGQC